MNLVIETHQLRKDFGTTRAVQDLNLHVAAGQVFGFLGPNGAGKTTTIRLLLGLLRTNAGEIRLFGQTLTSGLLGRVGALVETPSLYPHLTGEENLEVTRRLRNVAKHHIPRVLKIVDLERSAKRLVRTYSLGMRQRLGLALALLAEPELLILDEPTNGLDPAGILEMRQLIQRLPSEFGLTVFLSSHLLSEVELTASHVGIIHAGQMVFQGALADLQAQRETQLTVQVPNPPHAVAVLTQAGWAASLQAAGGAVNVQARSSTEAAEVNALLVRAGLPVSHLALERPSLEEIFLRLTQPEGSVLA
jgi:ABC-2 type transport system ATP-binding protein